MLNHFGVSRGSLREALRILEIQGIVTMKPGPGGGPVVAPHHPADYGRLTTLQLQVRGVTYRELLEARLNIEPTMARLAAQRVDASIADELERNLEAARSLPGQEYHAILDVWADFHGMIGRFSGNGVLDLMASALHEVYRERIVYRDQFSGRRIEPSTRTARDREHKAIARAILEGRAADAEKLMAKHMQGIVDGAKRRDPVLMDEVITWQ